MEHGTDAAKSSTAPGRPTRRWFVGAAAVAVVGGSLVPGTVLPAQARPGGRHAGRPLDGHDLDPMPACEELGVDGHVEGGYGPPSSSTRDLALCGCPHGCPTATVWHDQVAGRPLRHRLAYNADGTGRHSDRRAEQFAGDFYRHICEPIFRDIDGYSRWVGGPGLDWVGNVGVTVCKSGMHGLGRAFDLTRVQMRGWGVDCNTAWRADRSRTVRRRYLAVVATCRTYAGTVLTTWYNAAHGNHIHFDDGVAFTRLRPAARSDTTLVQAACNLLTGAGLAVDGAWGPLTEASYTTLRHRLGRGGEDPKRSPAHARRFLAEIALAGFADRTP